MKSKSKTRTILVSTLVVLVILLGSSQVYAKEGVTPEKNVSNLDASVDVQADSSHLDPDCDTADCCPAGFTVVEYTEGEDTVTNLSANQCLVLFGGNDAAASITGGETVVLGGDGSDSIKGGFGPNQIAGGRGDDEIFGGRDSDEIHGGSGNDLIHGSIGADRLNGNAGNDTLAGGPGDDILTGGGGSDEIRGDGGEDRIDAGPGADIVLGGSGADILWGSSGNDWLTGDGGDDEIHGERGDDLIHGSDGDDLLIGGMGNDIVYGGEDNDTMEGNYGDDLLWGDGGNDIIIPGPGLDEVRGMDGDDTVILRGVCEVVDGETLYGGSGQDTLLIPVPLSELQAQGLSIYGFEQITVEPSLLDDSECGAVTDPAELQKMIDYIENLYPAEAIQHQFTNLFGQEIDCIDFYAQPGLTGTDIPDKIPQPPVVDNQPLLNGSNVSTSSRAGSDSIFVYDSTRLDERGRECQCPGDSVRMVVMEIDHLREYETLETYFIAGDLSDRIIKGPPFTPSAAPACGSLEECLAEPPNDGPIQDFEYAAGRQMVHNWGIKADVNLWQPFVEPGDKASIYQLWIAAGEKVGGSGSPLQTVEAGFSVGTNWDPSLDHVLFFVFATHDSYLDAQWSQVAKGFNVVPSAPITHAEVICSDAPGSPKRCSQISGSDLEVELMIAVGAYPVSIMYWVILDGEAIGYFEFFEHETLGDGADIIQAGAELHTHVGGPHTSTDLGSGKNPYFENNLSDVAFMRNVMYFGMDYQWHDAFLMVKPEKDMNENGIIDPEERKYDPLCYGVKFVTEPDRSTSIYYGGNGYDSHLCR